MNDNILKIADLATITNWIMIIGVAVLLVTGSYIMRNSKKK